jgi:SSS family solute:Na+ symporter
MSQPLHPIDLGILALYAVVLLYLGLRLWRRETSGADDYLLAGRRLTLPAFVMTLVTTWYGGILGIGEYTYRYGIANWFVFGLPYYVAALLFALFFAARARRTRFRNLPDQLYGAYGPTVARAGALVVFLMTIPAGYVLMVGVTIGLIFQIPLSWAIVIGTLISVGYVYLGGFGSVVRTDEFQFYLMYAGFIALLVFLWIEVGSPAAIWSQLPASHVQPTGGQSIWAILVWYFIALATLMEPTFYQRCYAARDERTARRGLFVSIGFWLLFDILTTITGLYAVVLYPNLSDPVQSFPLLAQDYLPVGVRGLFFVTLLAVIMSTVDSYTFVAAVTGGRDLALPRRLRGDDRAETRASRAALPFVAVGAMVIALYFRSVVDIWYVFGTVGTPALLLPVITTFFPRARFRPRGALANLVLAGGLALAWEIGRQHFGTDGLPWAVPAIYPGLLTSVTVWSTDLFTRRSEPLPAPANSANS